MTSPEAMLFTEDRRRFAAATAALVRTTKRKDGLKDVSKISRNSASLTVDVLNPPRGDSQRTRLLNLSKTRVARLHRLTMVAFASRSSVVSHKILE
jgi:hypothetical protein